MLFSKLSHSLFYCIKLLKQMAQLMRRRSFGHGTLTFQKLSRTQYVHPLKMNPAFGQCPIEARFLRLLAIHLLAIILSLGFFTFSPLFDGDGGASRSVPTTLIRERFNKFLTLVDNSKGCGIVNRLRRVTEVHFVCFAYSDGKHRSG